MGGDFCAMCRNVALAVNCPHARSVFILFCVSVDVNVCVCVSGRAFGDAQDRLVDLFPDQPVSRAARDQHDRERCLTEPMAMEFEFIFYTILYIINALYIILLMCVEYLVFGVISVFGIVSRSADRCSLFIRKVHRCLVLFLLFCAGIFGTRTPAICSHRGQQDYLWAVAYPRGFNSPRGVQIRLI